MTYLKTDFEKLKKIKEIKIIQTPPGEAPEWIRSEWVGLVLPILRNMPPRTYVGGVLDGEVRELEDYLYSIKTAVAIELLGAKSPEAKQWWMDNVNSDIKRILFFRKQDCEVVS